ncbi:hypothetical protein ACERII_19695 [Evansella sp. AB-rgal1]|uniref:hypothetical protein n=1 Tax=Evansella sp. AB-rgal1 TaxID=3242696 RepID=UPI00359ECFC1
MKLEEKLPYFDGSGLQFIQPLKNASQQDYVSKPNLFPNTIYPKHPYFPYVHNEKN